ncbi:hypothetical protein P8A18_32100 [Streptomyces castrisilvae]|uniref:Knr4/Smi1-like domain-containing protein n=1 Tax=Streptomyces castrisilvae TaxID=3033811 RepID=A0ABY9HUN7_9ACTN|nr:hypothetical protein [Streptomyces sp. Mut1]WLQ37799.1 hypothetical protein P8A18_32100 [Streptomyces sp. Mut1]
MSSEETPDRIGSCHNALQWISASRLPMMHKRHLEVFVTKFQPFTFFRDSPEQLDNYESADRLSLPTWFRTVREVLGFIHTTSPTHPPVLAQFDAPDYDCNMADAEQVQWYQLKLGVMGEDDAELFVNQAGLYPIATWFGTDQSYLAINLRDREDKRIHEFSGADFWDMSFNGESLNGSSQPAFSSYSKMLSHISRLKLPDGAIFSARHE